MTLKVIQGHHWNGRYSIGHISLPISGQWWQRLHLARFPRYYHI